MKLVDIKYVLDTGEAVKCALNQKVLIESQKIHTQERKRKRKHIELLRIHVCCCLTCSLDVYVGSQCGKLGKPIEGEEQALLSPPGGDPRKFGWECAASF